MKKLVFLTLIMAFAYTNIKAQFKLLPATGYVGIGTIIGKSIT